MRRFSILIIAISLAGALPFMGSSLPSGAVNAPLNMGTIIGTFKLIGGPPPGEDIPARGTVIFAQLRKDSESVKVAVKASGRFSLHLPAGSWTVSASSPQFNHSEPGACGTQHPITVKVGKKTNVAVHCEVP